MSQLLSCWNSHLDQYLFLGDLQQLPNWSLTSAFTPLKKKKIGVLLLYIVVSVAAVLQGETAVCINISPLRWISFQFRSPQSTEQSSLCYTVGSHQLSILYVHVCALSHFSCVRLFATPRAVTHQAPLSMGFSRQEYWSGLPCLPPGTLPDPVVKPVSLMSPALAGRFFTSSTTWEPHFIHSSGCVSTPVFQFIPSFLPHLVFVRLFSATVSLFLLGKYVHHVYCLMIYPPQSSQSDLLPLSFILV